MGAKFDSNALYERLYLFGLNCGKLTRELPQSPLFVEYGTQLIRSSGANYIEALAALSKKDFIHRLKISRKEVKESNHWLRLLKDLLDEDNLLITVDNYMQEGEEVKKILTSSIVTLETR
jgi:four helix bundle protein